MRRRLALAVAAGLVSAMVLARAQDPGAQPEPPKFQKITIAPAGRSWQSADGKYGFNVDGWQAGSWFTVNMTTIGGDEEVVDPDNPPVITQVPDGTVTVKPGTQIRSAEVVKDIDKVYDIIVNALAKSEDLHEKLRVGCEKQGVTSIAIRLVYDDKEVTGGQWRRQSNLVLIDLADISARAGGLTPGPGVSAEAAAAANALAALHDILRTIAHELEHVKDGEGEFDHSDPKEDGAQGFAPLDENHVMLDLGIDIERTAYSKIVDGQWVTPYTINGHQMYDVIGPVSAEDAPADSGGEKYAPAVREAINGLPGHRCGASGGSDCYRGAGANDRDWDGVFDRSDNCPDVVNPEQHPACGPLVPLLPPGAIAPLRPLWSLRSSFFGASASRPFEAGQDFGGEVPSQLVSPSGGRTSRLVLYQRPMPPDQAIRVVVTALGRSTGVALRVHLVNRTSEPFRLVGGRVALEPVIGVTERDAARELASLGATAAPIDINGYCLDREKAVPPAGMVLRLAPDRDQQAFEPIRSILAASQHLQLMNGLHPDSDPTGYYHAIRQWAIWTHRDRFDEERFARAYEEHTRRNFASSGRPWTNDVQRRLRDTVPGRWRDIQAVLSQAGLAR
jgi:hypothetical protein